MRNSLIAFMAALSLATPSLAQQATQEDAPRELARELPLGRAQASSDTLEGAQTVSAEQGGNFYCRRKLGTWFYCDKPKARPRSAVPAPAQPRQSAAEQMKAIAAELDELKARAVLEPTTANVTAYIVFQRQQLDRASMFADVWQRAIWQNPNLDYTLQRPVSTVAKRAWIDNRAADRAAVLQRIGRN